MSDIWNGWHERMMLMSNIVSFQRDTVILKEGETRPELYKILKGKAELYVGGYKTPTETILGIIGEQAIFGEFGLLLRKPSIYTVVAFSDILALRIAEEDFVDFVSNNSKNVIDIMRNMANFVYSMKYQLDQLLDEIEREQKNAGSRELIRTNIRNAKQMMRQYAMMAGFNGTPA